MYLNDFFKMYRRWEFLKKIASPLVNKIRKPVASLVRQTGDARGGQLQGNKGRNTSLDLRTKLEDGEMTR